MKFPSTRSYSTRLVILLTVAVTALFVTSACNNSDDASLPYQDDGPVILADGTQATQTPSL